MLQYLILLWSNWNLCMKMTNDLSNFFRATISLTNKLRNSKVNPKKKLHREQFNDSVRTLRMSYQFTIFYHDTLTSFRKRLHASERERLSVSLHDFFLFTLSHCINISTTSHPSSPISFAFAWTLLKSSMICEESKQTINYFMLASLHNVFLLHARTITSYWRWFLSRNDFYLFYLNAPVFKRQNDHVTPMLFV